ncbi:MAG: hypothetical protein JSV22_03750 [Bacteroidales bacterium]|nr:MAG: hypothetical protein JSV22_03750 [Bacteroidales bacterium]
MKKVIIIIVAALFLFSCSKDEEGNIIWPAMSAVIDGVEWNSATRVSVLEEGKFIITGTSLNGESLSITVLGSAEGVYQLNLSSAKVAAVYKESINVTTEDTYVSVTGEVELTDVDTSRKKISGTFSFVVLRKLTETINITDGEFTNLTYTVTGQ